MLVNLFKSGLLFPKHVSPAIVFPRLLSNGRWFPAILLLTQKGKEIWEEHMKKPEFIFL